MDNYLLVVADYYKLTSRVNGQYSPDGGKDLIRSKIVVDRKHVESVNSEYNVNNLHYVIDEDATREYHEVKKPQMMAERQAAKALAKQGEVSTLAAAIQLAANPAPAKPAPKKEETTKPEDAPKYPEGKPNADWSKKQVQNWMDEAGIEYDKRAGVEKLLTTIKEHKEG